MYIRVCGAMEMSLPHLLSLAITFSSMLI